VGFEWVPVDEWSDPLASAQRPAARTVLSEDAVPPGLEGTDRTGPVEQQEGAQRHGRHARGGAAQRAGDRSGHRRPPAGPAAWRRYLHFK
jgi:hypothetical protein